MRRSLEDRWLRAFSSWRSRALVHRDWIVGGLILWLFPAEEWNPGSDRGTDFRGTIVARVGFLIRMKCHRLERTRRPASPQCVSALSDFPA